VAYQLIFYCFYVFVNFGKKNFGGFLFRDVKYGSILILTLHEMLNLIVISRLLKVNFLTNGAPPTFTIIIFMIPIFGINYFLFGLDDKYKATVNKMNLKKRRIIIAGKVFTTFYSVVTFLAIFLT
jgi:hypothetical protein